MDAGKGHGTGEQGQQGAHGQAAPGPGCSSCGQPDSGQSHGPPCSELRGALCGLGQVTEPIWASVSPPVKQHLQPTVVMKINRVLGQPGPRDARDRSKIEIGNQKRNTAPSHIRFGSGEGGREELGKTQALSLGWINGERGLGWWCLGRGRSRPSPASRAQSRALGAWVPGASQESRQAPALVREDAVRSVQGSRLARVRLALEKAFPSSAPVSLPSLDKH